MTEGRKNDSEKPRIGLISWIFLRGLAAVLTYGAKKYAANNWRGGIGYERLFNALQRHLWAWWSGEDYDFDPNCAGCRSDGRCPDHSGFHHLDNAACELMFLREMVEMRKDLDDRWKLPS